MRRWAPKLNWPRYAWHSSRIRMRAILEKFYSLYRLPLSGSQDVRTIRFQNVPSARRHQACFRVNYNPVRQPHNGQRKEAWFVCRRRSHPKTIRITSSTLSDRSYLRKCSGPAPVRYSLTAFNFPLRQATGVVRRLLRSDPMLNPPSRPHGNVP